jgi:hypothetical protein
MSVWRQKAIDCTPELKKEFEQPDMNFYTVFSDLLPILRQAQINNDNSRLERIYGFAEWCMKQKDQNLWNPVGVSFYEHLIDTDETFLAFTNWIKKDIYLEIRNLLYQRLDEKRMNMLDGYYGWKEQKKK